MVELFDYLESRDDADELITEFGQTIALRRATSTGPAYDPTLTTVDYATKGAKVEFTIKQMQGGNVLSTDERWLVAAGPLTALAITILPSDALTIGGNDVQIVKADPVAPAGTVVMYDCHVRV